MAVRAHAEHHEVHRGGLAELVQQFLLVACGRVFERLAVIVCGGVGARFGAAAVGGHRMDLRIAHTPLGDERVEQCGAGRAVVAFVAVGGHEPFVAPPDMHA